MHKLAHTSSTTTALEFMNGMEAYEEGGGEEEDEGRMGAVKEMMYKMAAMQPVDIDPATIKKPKRRNVRISEEPQSVVARQRRERISERMRILQRMVPGGTKMDTASMLDEAVRYVKFLQRQVQELQAAGSVVVPVLVQEAHAVFVNGVADMEWVSHGHGHASSSSSAIGAPAATGLGFGFTTTTTNATNNH